MFSSIYKRYSPAIKPSAGADNDEWMLVFYEDKLAVKETDGILSIPKLKDFEASEIIFSQKQYLGEVEGYPCYCMEASDASELPDGIAFRDLRSVLGVFEEDIFMLLGRAFQIVRWNKMNKFCGRCGSLTENSEKERAKVCPSCGSIFYPRISPAIITAIVRDNKILLAHNKNFKGGRHSVIAGFVETGETFEDCVRREIMEEVGIKVKNIKYFGSQPWPFPDSLMIGFTAEYESGEICVDGVEIDHADWYSKDQIPEVPGKVSIAGHLINWFVENH